MQSVQAVGHGLQILGCKSLQKRKCPEGQVVHEPDPDPDDVQFAEPGVDVVPEAQAVQLVELNVEEVLAGQIPHATGVAVRFKKSPAGQAI